MIEKIAEYIQDPSSEPIVSFVEKDGLVKTASSSYDPVVAEYLQNLKKEKGFIYALVNALTAGEFYSSNRNGDYFPEEALKKYHNTFVEHGYVYKHHINKNPEKSMGKVIFSHYNPEMRRVEVVIRMKEDHPDVQRLAEDINCGKLAKVSMGCKVPYDKCSITGKEAKTREQYSEYLKHKMNQVLPDGRKVYAINEKPRFFDLSIVTIPADPVAAFMVPLMGGVEKTASFNEEAPKEAQITKRIETAGEIDSIQADPKNLIYDSTKPIPDSVLKKLAEFPLNESLSTLMAFRILPKREEFQKLALFSLKKEKLAYELEKQGKVFEIKGLNTSELPTDLGPDYVNEKIAEIISPIIGDCSLTKPLIISRILEKNAFIIPMLAKIDGSLPDPDYKNSTPTEKSFISKLLFDDQPEPVSSGVKDPTMLYATIGTLYAGYATLFGRYSSPGSFTAFLGKNPWLGPVAGIALSKLLTVPSQNVVLDPVNESLYKSAGAMSGAEKTLLTFGAVTPLTYWQSAKAEAKARQGIPISNTENFVRKNPFLTAAGTTLGIRSIAKGISKSRGAADEVGSAFRKNASLNTLGYLNSLDTKTINSIFNEIIS